MSKFYCFLWKEDRIEAAEMVSLSHKLFVNTQEYCHISIIIYLETVMLKTQPLFDVVSSHLFIMARSLLLALKPHLCSVLAGCPSHGPLLSIASEWIPYWVFILMDGEKVYVDASVNISKAFAAFPC